MKTKPVEALVAEDVVINPVPDFTKFPLRFIVFPVAFPVPKSTAGVAVEEHVKAELIFITATPLAEETFSRSKLLVSLSTKLLFVLAKLKVTLPLFALFIKVIFPLLFKFILLTIAVTVPVLFEAI